MAQLRNIAGITFEGSGLVPIGKHLLWRDGKRVWCGDIGMPIEDVECDRITLNPDDFERVCDAAMLRRR